MHDKQTLTIEELREALDKRRFGFLRTRFRAMEPADIAELFLLLEPPQWIMVLRLVAHHRRAELFSYFPFEIQEKLLEELPDIVVTALINEMEADDRTKLLEELPQPIASKIIFKLSPEERNVAWQLLSYPEDSIGRLMSPEFLALNSKMSANNTIEYIRWNASRYPEEVIQHFFIVDDDGHYLGDISLAGILVADPTSQPIVNIMRTSYEPLSAYDDQEVAVDHFRKYDRNFLPVVNDHNVLVGIVTADDVFDVAEEEATQDIQQFGGTGTLEESYFQTPLITLLKKRATWLALLFIGGLLTGTTLQGFQATFNAMHFLVVFLPLIISSGGNSGSQAASLIIRGLAIKDMELKDWYKVFFREMLTGLCLGMILGALGFMIAMFWGFGKFVAVIVAVAVVGVVEFGAVVGAMLPFILKRFNFDPAVSSSPLIASIVDVVGILIFFNLAILAMHFFN